MDKLLEQTIQAAKKQPKGKPYKLEDLFSEQYWNDIPKGDKLSLGHQFAKWVDEYENSRISRAKNSNGKFNNSPANAAQYENV